MMISVSEMTFSTMATWPLELTPDAPLSHQATAPTAGTLSVMSFIA